MTQTRNGSWQKGKKNTLTTDERGGRERGGGEDGKVKGNRRRHGITKRIREINRDAKWQERKRNGRKRTAIRGGDK